MLTSVNVSIFFSWKNNSPSYDLMQSYLWKSFSSEEVLKIT